MSECHFMMHHSEVKAVEAKPGRPNPPQHTARRSPTYNDLPTTSDLLPTAYCPYLLPALYYLLPTNYKLLTTNC